MSQRRRKFKPGSVISGTNYKVIRHIGSGAMGAVYEAVHCELNKIFVVKVLHQDLVEHDDPVRRLRCEWQLLARLEHPNIVSVTDAGFTNDGVPYFVMERLEGETLYSRMNREPRWSVQSCVQLALELLDGLVEAHAKGIVHRDIKPSNIFLPRQFGAKLLDFGIAKLLDSDAAITAKGVTLGTPRYMAPEQACGQIADCRSDLYSLGVILFELVAGEHPFAQAQTPVEMLIAQAGWEPPPLRIGGVGQTDEFIAIVGKLLSKNPKDRPATAVAARNCFLGISSGMDLRQAGVEYSRFDWAELVEAPKVVAVTTQKLALAHRAILPKDPTKLRERISNRHEPTVLGRRASAVRCSPRQICLAVLVATAALSASSLATPFPIHRVLSSVWFGGHSSPLKLTSKLNNVAVSSSEPGSLSDEGRPASVRTATENEDAQPRMWLVPAAGPSGQPRKKAYSASSSAVQRRANSSVAVVSASHNPVPALRPNEVSKGVFEVGDQSRPNAEYDNLTRR